MSDDRFNPRSRGRNWLDSYYYWFGETSCEPVDHILAAVAAAGKAYHSTADWQEPTWGGESPADAIQRMADDAAEAWRKRHAPTDRFVALLAAQPCEHHTHAEPGTCIANGRTPFARYGADAACMPCSAWWTLRQSGVVEVFRGA